MKNLTFSHNNKKVVILDGLSKFDVYRFADGMVEIFFHGTIYGFSENFERGAYIYKTYKDKKLDSFSNLFGRFLVIIQDLQNETITIANDRYGLIPFFEYQSRDRLFFAFSLKSLLQCVKKKQLDYSALGEILAFSTPFNQKTLFQGIHSLQPGIIRKLDLTTLQKNTVFAWKAENILSEEKIKFSENEQKIFNMFLEGFEKATSNAKNINLTLSGGIDSRCLLAFADFIKRIKDVSAYNVCVPGTRSVQYAEKMAEYCKIPFKFVSLTGEFNQKYYSLLQSVVRETEGMSFCSEVEGTWLRDNVPADRSAVMLHGAFAELSKIGSMHYFFYEKKMEGKSRKDLCEMFWQRFSPTFFSRLEVFSSEVKEQIQESAKKSLFQKIEGMPKALNAEDLAIAIYIEEYLNTVAKWSNFIWNGKIQTVFPFSYPPYLDMVLRLTLADKFEQKTQISFLQKTSRFLYEFPDSNTGTKVDAPQIWKQIVDISTRIKGKIFRTSDLYDHMDLISWIRNMSPTPEDMLLSETDDHFYDRKKLQQLIECARNGNNEKAYDLQFFLMFELWKREYLVGA